MSELEYSGKERRRQAWHLDKRIPIIFFLTLIMEASAFIWWAAEINILSKRNSDELLAQSKRMDAFEQRERDSSKLTERIVRVETMVEGMVRVVNRIDDSLEKRRQQR